MNPNNPSMPQNLPSASGGAPMPVSPPPAAPQQSGALNQQLAEKMNEQVKALVIQYQEDPYKLCGALQQLKAAYLAENFHITLSAVDR